MSNVFAVPSRLAPAQRNRANANLQWLWDKNERSGHTGISPEHLVAGGRCWTRTSGLFGVNEALYH